MGSEPLGKTHTNLWGEMIHALENLQPHAIMALLGVLGHLQGGPEEKMQLSKELNQSFKFTSISSFMSPTQELCLCQLHMHWRASNAFSGEAVRLSSTRQITELKILITSFIPPKQK